MKLFFRTIHLYLALAAGLFIILACVTGTMMVFEEEIQHYVNPDRYYVSPQQTRLMPEQLIGQAQRSVPASKPSFLKIYADKTRSVEIGLIVRNPASKPSTGSKATTNTAKANLKDGEKTGNQPTTITVYVDPYTGKVLASVNQRKTFFKTIEMFHRFLLGGQGSVGKYVMNFSAAVFFFIILTGIILWWPKTSAILKQRLKYKVKGGNKRLSHDLHTVTGFYLSPFLLIIAATGLIMAFPWLNQALFKAKGSKQDSLRISSAYSAGAEPIIINQVLESMGQKTDFEYKLARFPKDSLGVFTVSVLANGAFANEVDTYFIEQYSGKTVATEKFAEKSAGERMRSYIKPIHTGAIYGLATKTISFFVCLFSLSFPVTGVIMWLNRTKKKKVRMFA